MKKLNLGCGKSPKKGYINLDSVKLSGVDIVHNLNKYPWPFKNNELDYVFGTHILEHLENIIEPMEEIWRITKSGARVLLEVPIFPSIGVAADPTHKSFYTYQTFNYFRPEDSLNYYSKARFKILERKIIFPKHFSFFTWFFNLSESMQKAYTLLFSFIFPAYALRVELETIK